MDISSAGAVVLLVAAIAPILTLRLHRRRSTGDAATAMRWRLASAASVGAIVVGLLLGAGIGPG